MNYTADKISSLHQDFPAMVDIVRTKAFEIAVFDMVNYDVLTLTDTGIMGTALHPLASFLHVWDQGWH